MWRFSFKLWPLFCPRKKPLYHFYWLLFVAPVPKTLEMAKFYHQPWKLWKILLNYLENKKPAHWEELQPSFDIFDLGEAGFKDLVSISIFPKFSAIGVWIIESWTKNRIQNCCRTQNWPWQFRFRWRFCGCGFDPSSFIF